MTRPVSNRMGGFIHPRGEHQAADLLRKGLDAASSGNHPAAVVFYRQLVAQRPDHFNAHNFLGTSLREQGDLVGAIAAYNSALSLRPRNAEVRVHLAEAQRRLGLRADAVASCTEALELDRRNSDAFLIRALARKDLGEIPAAIDDLRAAARLTRNAPAMLKMLARTLIDAGQKAEALDHLEAILEVMPADAEATRLAADCYYVFGRIQEASAAYSKAIDLDPSCALAFSNLSGLLCFTGQLDMGLAAASIAVRLDPNLSGAHFNLGLAHEAKGQLPAAVDCYVAAIRCKPDLGVAHYATCRLRRHDCAWEEIETAETVAQDLTYRRGEPVSPFGALPMTGSPQDLFVCNSVWAGAMTSAVRRPLATYAPRPVERRTERLRIGYLSADFCDHATAALISELFELHDATRFETFGYSIGDRNDGPKRRRLVAALNHFDDLNAFSHEAAAARIHADEIDILVDLKGYTFQARPQIVAHRPAPIQVNYLGYPSTMGAPFVDYMIADAIVAPFAHQAFYSEKIVHLPHSYQPNDRKRTISGSRPDRSACGLPANAFVFCCFNGNYKLNARMFEIWMNLLRAVPGSVLWLLESNPRAPGNLRREAVARGIEPDRIVFAPKLAVEDHLARMSLGDLFLDTVPVGAHTTASEALWTGLPVLTCLGDAFPARVGASLVSAVGLPDLVAPNLAAYEAMAIHLARHPSELAALRARLAVARSTAPLFDTTTYVRHYEAALLQMAARRDLGEPPAAFSIEA